MFFFYFFFFFFDSEILEPMNSRFLYMVVIISTHLNNDNENIWQPENKNRQTKMRIVSINWFCLWGRGGVSLFIIIDFIYLSSRIMEIFCVCVFGGCSFNSIFCLFVCHIYCKCFYGNEYYSSSSSSLILINIYIVYCQIFFLQLNGCNHHQYIHS